MTDPTVAVARNLTEITELHAQLSARALDLANSSLMPGGDAMAELAPTGNLDVWAARQSLDEDRGVRHDHAEDGTDDAEWTAYQRLRYWSEAWRAQHGADYADLVPSLGTEANFLRSMLGWAWEHEIHWDDFVDDMGAARAQLENVLRQGVRPAFRGVPCEDAACGGAKLIRTTVAARGDDGAKVWKLTDWHCPRCKLSWDEDAYARIEARWRMANEARGHFLHLDGDVWVSVVKASEIIGQPAATIWHWISKRQVQSREIKRRHTYVHLDSVRDREKLRSKRSQRAIAAMMAKRTGVQR